MNYRGYIIEIDYNPSKGKGHFRPYYHANSTGLVMSENPTITDFLNANYMIYCREDDIDACKVLIDTHLYPQDFANKIEELIQDV